MIFYTCLVNYVLYFRNLLLSSKKQVGQDSNLQHRALNAKKKIAVSVTKVLDTLSYRALAS